ncbi:MAG: NifB/NifX family molybdenum-iron cluster-binding protein [Candidatus Woesearchaeota archaeon]
MRLVITIDDSRVNQRFGRCRQFMVVDEKGRDLVDNEGAQEEHGAGIRAAQQVANLNPTALITGEVGPKASEVLKKMGVKAYHAHGMVEDAISDFKEGKLEVLVDPGLICVPLLDSNDLGSRISEHFGHAPYMAVYNPHSDSLVIQENPLDHQSAKSPADQLMELVNPSTIFALGMGGRAINQFSAYGVSLKTGPYKTVKEMIQHMSELEDLTKTCKEE